MPSCFALQNRVFPLAFKDKSSTAMVSRKKKIDHFWAWRTIIHPCKPFEEKFYSNASKQVGRLTDLLSSLFPFQSSAVDLKTKEEKDAELDKRIEALRKKNEALVKRYQVWRAVFKYSYPLSGLGGIPKISRYRNLWPLPTSFRAVPVNLLSKKKRKRWVLV